MKRVRNLNFLNTLYKVFLLIKPSKRKNLIYILFCILATGVAEMITLASFVPFLIILSNPSEIYNLRFIGGFFNLFNISNDNNVAYLISIVFAIAITFSGLLRLFNIWINGRFSADIGSDLSNRLFEQILGRSYEKHINENSSESINLLTLHINNVVGVFNSSLQIVSALFISVFIFFTLLFINFKVSLFALILVLFLYLIIYKIVVNKLTKNSFLVSRNIKRQIQIIQETLGSIKDILLSNNQNRFLQDYLNYDKETRKKLALSNFLSLFPRVTIEFLALLSLVSFSTVYIINSNNTNELIIIIGTLAIAAQRLLPLCQQIYYGLASINNNKSSIEKVISSLNKNKFKGELTYLKELKFEKYILLKDISFKYRNSNKKLLSDINIKIKKGDSIGIVGETGSGKTTLIDIIMGLLTPSSGYLIVDDIRLNQKDNNDFNKSWQRKISYVPQNIYLSDSNYEENIAFSSFDGNIDFERVKIAAEKSVISEFINESSNGYKTFIGERGLKISGGEKQRIGIARALYKSHEVLVLDESTSAMDNTTEDLLMDSLYKHKDDITLIIVAHRLRTLKKCDQIIELKKGKVDWVGTSKEFFKKI